MPAAEAGEAANRGVAPWLMGLLVFVGLAAAHVFAMEPTTSMVEGPRQRYRTVRYELDPRWVAGVGPHVRHATNGQGLRGDVVVGADHELLLVGDSTVESGLLDEPDAFVTRVVESVAATQRKAGDSTPVRAAALAQSGVPAFALLGEVESFLAGEHTPDVLVLVAGASDAQTFVNHAPWVSSAPNTPWEVWLDPDSPFGVRGRKETYRGWYQPGNHGRFLDAPRQAYADERLWTRELHPGHVAPLATALRAYVDTLRALRAACEREGIALVLVTQPLAPWRPPSPGRGWAPFLYAREGAGFLPSPGLLRELVGAFNAQTRGFAAEHGIPLVDLDATLSDCEACFYDQWHFTDEGARRAAGEIAPVAAAALTTLP